ncbi:copper homeostasis membrane protein CopD, partial [Thioclava sp. BHET1]
LILMRGLQFLAALLLWGGGVFRHMLAPPSLAADLARPAARVALLALLALSGLGWLLIETAEAAGDWSAALDPGTIWAILTETDFGPAWALHLALIAALILCRWLGPHKGPLPLILSGLVVASLALVGHAAMLEGWAGIGQRLNAALHLLSAGLWIGGLPALALCLAGRAGQDQPEATRLTMIRYSRMGHVAVALVLLTGAINGWLVLGRWPLDLARSYDLLLDLKIVAVLAMVLLAVINRYHFVPRLRGVDALAARRSLLRGTLIEVGLALAALALVAGFATMDPG